MGGRRLGAEGGALLLDLRPQLSRRIPSLLCHGGQLALVSGDEVDRLGEYLHAHMAYRHCTGRRLLIKVPSAISMGVCKNVDYAHSVCLRGLV